MKQQDTRDTNQEGLVRAEWTVLIGETLVAAGSIVVVIGLVRAFKTLVHKNDIK